ncbi:MAG: acyltransferase [Polyangiales bacterium]
MTPPCSADTQGVVQPTAAPRWIALDVLRGLMALAVAVYHLSVWTHALEGRVRNLAIVAGIYSVQGFFILSGLCFFGLHGRARIDRGWLRDFYLRRYLRLAPLFYVAIALNYALGTPVDPTAGWFRIAENLSLGFALTHPNHALVLGGWSIGIEWLFYGAFPWLAWLTRRRVWLYVLLACAIGWAVPWTFGKVAATPTAKQFNAYVQIPNHAWLFLVGGVIADLRERVAWRLRWWIAVPLSAALAAWLLVGEPDIVDHIDVMVGVSRVRYVSCCATLIAIWSLVDTERAARDRRVLRFTSPLRWLGDLSYSVYLMHPFAWWWTSRNIPAGSSPLAQLSAGLVVTLVLAALTHVIIERPAIALGRRLTTTRRASAAAAAPLTAAASLGHGFDRGAQVG